MCRKMVAGHMNSRYVLANEETKICLGHTPEKNMKPKPNMSIPGCMLPWRLGVLFPVRDLYFDILPQPCYGTLPAPPPADKASII